MFLFGTTSQHALCLIELEMYKYRYLLTGSVMLLFILAV